MFYHSTRGSSEKVEASLAIIKGLADDGGLYVPDSIPKLDRSIEAFSSMTYQETAYEVMKLFFTDYTKDELLSAINKAYDDKFDHPEIAPVVRKGDYRFLELFHGRTIAFKDMALSILPHLMMTALEKHGIEQEVVILTATSGDTGKAALEGFSGVNGTKIIVFYPNGGVSPIQKQQMVTQKGDNCSVVGVDGNFDDAQNGVKAIFNDKAFNETLRLKGYQLSSANSINIGRLVPQVVYYVYAYSQLLKQGDIGQGEAVNFVVPTGNFGNILAGYYAKLMGLPINKLICASNENRVLFDFIRSGTYDRKREFVLTSSPSMDILISSNLERLIYRLTGSNGEETRRLMGMLTKHGEYTITSEMKAALEDFYGNYASEKSTAETIKNIYDETGYIVDPHTAVGCAVYNSYQSETNDKTKTVIVSTASPYKFTSSVMTAINDSSKGQDDFELIKGLSALGAPRIPNAITEILNAEIRHNRSCDKTMMKQEVEDILMR